MTPNPWFHLTIDRERLIDDMFAFVTDPTPARTARPVVRALDDIHPESVEVMESMLLDGTEERADIAAYVAAVFSSDGRSDA
ncbi:MAG: hypothetical protein IT337_12990 [Thermomicrobiales bacterium]|nr:hypothetical protein [Thermomicrobiales bacterium]